MLSVDVYCAWWELYRDQGMCDGYPSSFQYFFSAGHVYCQIYLQKYQNVLVLFFFKIEEKKECIQFHKYILIITKNQNSKMLMFYCALNIFITSLFCKYMKMFKYLIQMNCSYQFCDF